MLRITTFAFPARTSIQNTAAESKPLEVDRFEASNTLGVANLPNIEAVSMFWAHFLLDQQKSANLQIVCNNELLSRVMDSEEVSQFLTTYPKLKSSLEAFEKIKKWSSEDRTVHLKNNEDYLISLLKLLLDREDVHLIQWLDVSPQDYESFKTKQQAIVSNSQKNKTELEQKLAQLASLQSQLKKQPLLKTEIESINYDIIKQQNLVKINKIHLELIQEKMDIFNYVFTNKNNHIPLENLKNIVRTFIGPAVHQAKSWIIFGKICLQLATDLTNMAKLFHNTELLQKRNQLEASLRGIIETIKQEISKNNALISQVKPSL